MDNNELSTNLAEVGTDCISRQEAIKATWQDTGYTDPFNVMTAIRDRIKQLPPIQPSNNSENPNSSDTISRQAAIDAVMECYDNDELFEVYEWKLNELPPIQPKRGKWILDRSGAYCCSECMEPCASYVMMKPRDKFCKMCGSRNEVTT